MTNVTRLGILLAVSIFSLDLCAEDWPQWRGPHFNGSSREKNLPATWDKTNNVKWVATLPGMSGATPAIWNKQIFLSSPDAEKNLRLLCLDSDTGKTLWSEIVAVGDKGNN